MIPMPIEFADAVCDERMRLLSSLVVGDESNKDLRSLERYHAMNRIRSMPGYACAECKQKAERFWNKYQALTEKVRK